MKIKYVNEESHILYWIMMCCLCVFAVIRLVFEIHFPVFLYVIIGAILCVLCNREEIVSFICSMAPFTAIVPYRYMIFVGLFFLLLKSKKIKPINGVPILLIVLWEIMHSMFYGLTWIRTTRELIAIIAIAIVLMCESIDYSDGLSIISFSLMSLFGSAMTVVGASRSLGYSILSSNRLGDNYEVFEQYNGMLNSNLGSFMCVLSICAIGILITKNKEGNGKYLVLIALLSFFIFLYKSKTAFLSLAIALVLILYLNYNFKHFCVILCGSIAMIVVGLYYVFPNILAGILERFQAKDLSSGRVDIFRFYNNYLVENPLRLLFGVGLIDYKSRVAEDVNLTQAEYIDMNSGATAFVKGHWTLVMSHNGIQEILITWGLVGLLLVIILLFVVFKFEGQRRDFIFYIPIYFVLAYSLQGQFLSQEIQVIGLLFAIVCMRLMDYKIKNNVATFYKTNIIKVKRG